MRKNKYFILFSSVRLFILSTHYCLLKARLATIKLLIADLYVVWDFLGPWDMYFRKICIESLLNEVDENEKSPDLLSTWLKLNQVEIIVFIFPSLAYLIFIYLTVSSLISLKTNFIYIQILNINKLFFSNNLKRRKTLFKTSK